MQPGTTPHPHLKNQVERIEAGNARVDEFVQVTVPRIVDEQSGAVTRKLQKARETFDIENAKIAKRERKVIEEEAHRRILLVPPTALLRPPLVACFSRLPVQWRRFMQ